MLTKKVFIPAVLLMGVFATGLHAAQFQNPIQAAKDAYNKAKADAAAQKQQQPRGQNAPASQQTPPADDNAPFSPPAEATAAPPLTIDASKMPDLGGVRLGMTAMEAYKALQGGDPKVMPQIHAQLAMPTMQGGQLEGYSLGTGQLRPPPIQESVFLTPPPGKQVVWRVSRSLSWDKMYRMNALTSLREKYGQEAARYSNGNAVDAAHAQEIYWVFDSQGRPAKLPAGNDPETVIDKCRGVLGGGGLEYGSWFAPNNIITKEKEMADGGWCNTVGFFVIAQMAPEEIITRMTIDTIAMPIAAPAARAEIAWLKDVSQREYQRQVDESKKAKPSL